LATHHPKKAPAVVPTVPERMTKMILSSPSAAEYSASGMIASDGIGGKIFSSIIKTAIAQ